MPFLDKNPGGFLPTSQPQRMESEPLTGFEAFLSSLPDWLIFQQETIGAIAIICALAWWLYRIDRRSGHSQWKI
jgi:hypothetical protein